MRILILNHNMRERGTFFRAWPVARGLAGRGHDVVFTTVSPTRLYRTTVAKRQGVQVYETPRWTLPFMEPDEGWGPIGILERWKLARREKFDWVYSFAHTPNCYFPARAAVAHGAKLAVDWCDDFGEGIFPQREKIRAATTRKTPLRWAVQRMGERHEVKSEKRILNEAKRITVISEILRQKAMAAGVPESRILLVPSGADLYLFFPRSREDAKRELNLPTSNPMIVYVANYHPDEQFLLEVLSKVFSTLPSARLVYTGPPLRAPEHLRPYLIHLGVLPMEKVPVAIAAGTAALIPMDDTPHNRARCPQKLMDYLASGRPVITGNVGEVGRIMREFPEVGIASGPGVGDYADAIIQVMQSPLREREVMEKAARALAERLFNWERAVCAIEDFLLNG